MKNVGLTLSEALRYMFAGLVPFGLLYCVEPDWAERLLKNTGGPGLGLLALGWGSIAYFAYRPFYDNLILCLQDLPMLKAKGYRVYLKRRYGITRNEAQMLWRYIRDDITHGNLYGKSGFLETIGSGVHLLYLSAIQCLFFSVWRTAKYCWEQGLVMLIVASSLFIVGFIYDRQWEEFEGRLLRTIDDYRLDELAAQLGFTKRTE